VQATNLFYRFGVALVIGFLIGLQREYAYGDPEHEMFAGMRTFSLMSLVGCTAALLADEAGSAWPLAVVIFLVGAWLGTGFFIHAWRDEAGLTTEAAALLTVLVGALCYWDYLELAAATGVATTVLLSLKLEMQQFVRHITREDVYATLKFAVISAIILPVLPNQTYGSPPIDALNPHRVWLMVVFISGINFLGYVLVKTLGSRYGIGLTGVLGGLASSTAVTLSFTQRSRERPDLARAFALAITIAWTVMFPRVLVEVAALNTDLLQMMWAPMLASGFVGLAYCTFLYFSLQTKGSEDVEFVNPFKLGPAIKFGMIYAVILVLSRAAQIYLGNTGVYISSVVAGLTDVDAVTLSLAELSSISGGGSLDVVTASRAITLAAMANTIVKGGFVISVGSPTLRRAVVPALAIILVVGILVAFLIGA
jgi:uncharacterized membrane protein (DUF4010 family)